ncbi:MAG: hypothetical protein ABIG94_10045 [Pseudomonadota bacterium]
MREDDERERPSWREIDQRRDGSRHRQPARKPRVPKTQAEWVRKQALAQAEALFKGKRARPEYQAALRQLEACHGTKKFPLCARKFLEEYGLPEEWGALTRLLDYPEPGTVAAVLGAMAAQLGRRSRVEQQGFKGRLKVLALTSLHEEVRHRAEDILADM